MKQHTVLLVDDHVLVRAGIRSLIERLSDFTVMAEASNPDEAMAHIASAAPAVITASAASAVHTASAVPDIVLTDISMGAYNGLDLVRLLQQRFPQIAIIMLTMHASEELVTEALRLGASAYLLKESAPVELEIALRAVVRKETYLSPAVSTKMIERFVRQPVSVQGPLQLLTVRQLQILTMIANRKGTKEIAYELDLSEKTIAAHRAQIMERVGVRDIVGLVLLAVKHGLVKDGSA